MIAHNSSDNGVFEGINNKIYFIKPVYIFFCSNEHKDISMNACNQTGLGTHWLP